MRPKNGILAAGLAYIVWGLLPVYWKQLHDIPPLEILGHRVVWSLAVVVILLAIRQNWGWLGQARRRPAMLRPTLLTALLLISNWFMYIWANNNGHIVEASLGYFITPLVNVLLGLLVLRERLRPGQWLAVAIAATGVSYLLINAGGLLWISFGLAFTFGFYGLLRKTARLGSLEGLTAEMGILFLPALGYLLFLQATGAGAFGQGDTLTTILLIGCGLVTAIPLLFFAYGAKRVPLSALGVLQYIAPTLQFLLGVLVYGEAFTTTRLIGFSIIWVALTVYSIEGFWQVRRRRSAVSSATQSSRG